MSLDHFKLTGMRSSPLFPPASMSTSTRQLRQKNEEFNEVAKMLSVKRKDLKRQGLGNKPKAAQPLEEDEIEKIWSSGAVGLQNPRSVLHLVWGNNVTHLGMRAFNPLSPSIKLQILFLCFHTFLTEVVERSC